MEVGLGPNLNVALRIAVEMKLFESLPQNGEQISLAELSKKTGAEEEFVTRIARVLGAYEIVRLTYTESGLPNYSHMPYSRFMSSSAGRAATKHLFDTMFHGQTASAGHYFTKYGFKSPEDAKNCPYTFAHGAQNASFFDLLEKDPEELATFNEAMTFTATLGLKQTVSSYPFDQLQANADGIVLVDVGGGKGHVINEIRNTYPGIQGKMVLEDMQFVLEGGTVVPEEAGALQPYDFFKEVQPIKGANYFFKSIFHDWPDKACLQILQNLAPAMRGHPNSRLLICDLVIPDQNPDAGQLLRDMNMLLIGGKERSITQWRTLLGEVHFQINQIYGSEKPDSSIIEVVYKGED